MNPNKIGMKNVRLTKNLSFIIIIIIISCREWTTF